MRAKKYCGIDFKIEKYSHLDGLTKVLFFCEDNAPDAAFNIQVDKSGMTISGGLLKITSTRELESFAELIADAWAEHEKLAPKIVRTLSGHQ